MWNAYTYMRAKAKKDFDNTIHWNNLYNARLSMFEYTGLPDTILPEFLEALLVTQGTAGVTEYKGDLYTGSGGYCGNVFNFIPEEYQITVIGIPDDLRGKVGEKFAVCWNNLSASPDMSIMQFASILTEIDVSERCNVIFSRFLRIPKVHDSKEKMAIEQAVKAIINGNFEAVISDNISLSELIDGTRTEEFLDLVDVKEIDKLQYLNQYRDNVVKRFFQIYGHGMQTTAKLAQQTVDELHGNDAVSMIIPLQMLKKRKEFCTQMNKMFGTDVSVDFSETWRDSREEMHEYTKNGVPQKESGNNDVSSTSDNSDEEATA